LGQLPVLEIDYPCGKTTVMTQSNAILRYFGKLGGLYPKDDIKAMEVDSVLDILEDLLTGIITSMMGPTGLLISDDKDSWTAEEKMEIRKRWVTKSVPRFLGHIEKRLEKSESGWVVGDSMTIADLKIFSNLTWFTSGVLDGVPTTMLEEYPACVSLVEKVKTAEGTKKWTDNYSKPYGTFDYAP